MANKGEPGTDYKSVTREGIAHFLAAFQGVAPLDVGNELASMRTEGAL